MIRNIIHIIACTCPHLIACHLPQVYADPERAFGRESRSLKACYELLQARDTELNLFTRANIADLNVQTKLLMKQPINARRISFEI